MSVIFKFTYLFPHWLIRIVTFVLGQVVPLFFFRATAAAIATAAAAIFTILGVIIHVP
jgi:hypothetical protein